MEVDELRALLNGISVDLQIKCEDNEIMRADIEEYFDRIITRECDTMENKKIFHIVIEGHNAEQMQDLFEKIQNDFSFYDNCVLEESSPEDTIIDKDRFEETGHLIIDKEIVKKYGDE